MGATIDELLDLNLTEGAKAQGLIWERQVDGSFDVDDLMQSDIEIFTPLKGYIKKTGEWINGFYAGKTDCKIMLVKHHPLINELTQNHAKNKNAIATVDLVKVDKERKEQIEKLVEALKEVCL